MFTVLLPSLPISFVPRKPQKEELEAEEAGEEEDDIPSGSAGHGLGLAFMVAQSSIVLRDSHMFMTCR